MMLVVLVRLWFLISLGNHIAIEIIDDHVVLSRVRFIVRVMTLLYSLLSRPLLQVLQKFDPIKMLMQLPLPHFLVDLFLLDHVKFIVGLLRLEWDQFQIIWYYVAVRVFMKVELWVSLFTMEGIWALSLIQWLFEGL